MVSWTFASSHLKRHIDPPIRPRRRFPVLCNRPGDVPQVGISTGGILLVSTDCMVPWIHANPHTKLHLLDRSIRFCTVRTGLEHAQRDAVEQDHADADSLEPRAQTHRQGVKGKGKVFPYTRYRALGPELIPVYRQSARR